MSYQGWPGFDQGSIGYPNNAGKSPTNPWGLAVDKESLPSGVESDRVEPR
jgi:hypothetical protein